MEMASLPDEAARLAAEDVAAASSRRTSNHLDDSLRASMDRVSHPRAFPVLRNHRAPRTRSGAGQHSAHHAGSSVESLDFELFESQAERSFVQSQPYRDYQRQSVWQWVITFLIGVGTAIIAFGITLCTRRIGFMKFETIVKPLIEREVAGELLMGTSFFAYLAVNMALVAVAGLMVCVGEPMAGGSGIPEIKCTLNGLKIPRAVRVKTLVCKVIGVLCSVGGGMPVGKEGPMIHSGAILAAGISQGKSTTMGFDTSFSKFAAFRNDQAKRDFIACGAAAGVAAAFGSPVGGVLFCLEEGASWWHPMLTFRTFMAAMVSSYTVDILLSAIDETGSSSGHFGRLNTNGVFSFGDFTSSTRGDNGILYNVWEIPLFILVGALGGVLGAAFNQMNKKITEWRQRDNVRDEPTRCERAFLGCMNKIRGGSGQLSGPSYGALPGAGGAVMDEDGPGELRDSAMSAGGASGGIDVGNVGERGRGHTEDDVGAVQGGDPSQSSKRKRKGCLASCLSGGLPRKARWRRLRETLLVCAIMSILTFWVPYMTHSVSCRPVTSRVNQSTNNGTGLVQFYCPDGQYSQLGTLMFNTAEGSIKQLLHFESLQFESSSEYDDFSLWVLVLFYCIYFLLACWTYGLPIPSGLFIPSLLGGATIGRLIGECSIRYLPHFAAADPGTYALIGAAAGLGGMARMVISLTVILIECTGNVQYGLPIMVTLIASRWVGNQFNEGLYDIHIHLNGYPLLEWDPPHWYNLLTAADIMTPEPIALRVVERAGTILRFLRRTGHNGFPVVHSEQAGAGGGAGGDGEAARGVLAGLVLRKQLCVMLSDRYKGRVLLAGGHGGGPPQASRDGSVPGTGPAMSWQDFEQLYPRYVDVRDVRLTAEEKGMYIDLSPYLNPSPHTTQEGASLRRAFRQFRTLGLRHLCVVDSSTGELQGVITRSSLTSAHCREKFLESNAPRTSSSGITSGAGLQQPLMDNP